MAFQHPQGPVSECHQNFHDVLDDGPFMPCWEEWLVFAIVGVIKPLACEFS